MAKKRPHEEDLYVPGVPNKWNNWCPDEGLINYHEDDDYDRERFAVHEAAHAVIGRLFGLDVRSACIFEEGGRVVDRDMRRIYELRKKAPRSLVERAIIASFAGYQAECIFFSDDWHDSQLVGNAGDEHDVKQIHEMLELIGVPGSRRVGDRKWRKEFDRLRERSLKLCARFKREITLVANVLIERSSLYGYEIDLLLGLDDALSKIVCKRNRIFALTDPDEELLDTPSEEEARLIEGIRPRWHKKLIF